MVNSDNENQYDTNNVAQLMLKAKIIDDDVISYNDYIFISRTSVVSCKFALKGFNLFAWAKSDATIRLLDLNKCDIIGGLNEQLNTSVIDLKTLKNYFGIIKKIYCESQVTSLAFGSSKSEYKRIKNTNLHLDSIVNKRFQLENELVLAAGLLSGKINIYNAHSGELLFALCDHKEIIKDLKFSKDGSFQLATVSKDSKIKLWNMYDDGNMYKTLSGHIGTINSCDWSPTAPLFCSVGINRQAYIWDMSNFAIKYTLNGHQHDVVSCEFSSDGGLLATASFDTTVCLWNPYDGILIKQLFHLLPSPRAIYASGDNGHFVKSVSFSHNSDMILTSCDDNKIRVWSTRSQSKLHLAEIENSNKLCCTFTSDSRYIAVGSTEAEIYLYEADRKSVV